MIVAHPAYYPVLLYSYVPQENCFEPMFFIIFLHELYALFKASDESPTSVPAGPKNYTWVFLPTEKCYSIASIKITYTIGIKHPYPHDPARSLRSAFPFRLKRFDKTPQT